MPAVPARAALPRPRGRATDHRRPKSDPSPDEALGSGISTKRRR
jgi:hypothetical protein